jgi:heat shock protein HslJ
MLLTSACTAVQANKGEGDLTNSQWKLVSFGESGAETPVVEGPSITLEFEEEGQVGGSGGCNSYGAKYEMQGNTLTVQEITSTLMACKDEQVMEQEQQYFQALQSAASFEITGDALTIWYKDGQGRLNFVKATSG